MQEHIIQCLKKSKGYISGEEISRSANISRAAIWKYMQDLRKDGYEIEAVPHLGYQLVTIPDKLLPHEIQFELKTKVLGCKIFYYDSLGSTMDEAFKRGMDGAPEGTVVCAETQTKGRGRLGRSWSSPKHKGVYLSIILRPRLAPGELAKLTLLSAVALTEAMHTVSGVEARIKWPNDVMIRNKKVAGILTEVRAEVDQVKFVVVGIGLNVNNTSAALLETATSLKQESGRTISRVETVQEFLRVFERWYVRLEKSGFDDVIAAWKTQSHTLGRRVRITDPAGAVEGVAFDLDHDGGLLIRQDSGVVIKKMSGDVHLR